jgi:hypothetical protein
MHFEGSVYEFWSVPDVLASAFHGLCHYFLVNAKIMIFCTLQTVLDWLHAVSPLKLCRCLAVQ